jgi:hypothetical protein
LDGPNVDVGYYELDLTGAAKKYGNQQWPVGIRGRGGRQYITVGRGIALAQTLDSGSFDIETKDLFLTGFAGRTPEGRQNPDLSAPDLSHDRRTFYGLEARYRGIPLHEPYYFMVIQHDWGKEHFESPQQDWRYDSHYHGVGSRGQIIPDMQYAVESIWEFGESPANGQVDQTEDIRGYAFDSQIDYHFHHPLQPVASVEYAYASGDSDRQSATTALMGNRAGGPDTGFLGFGYVDSGLALAARFTNIQFVRVGGRVTPYDNQAGLGRIDVGLNFYWQFKTKSLEPISDFRADGHSHGLGKEIDLFLEWRILSDLAMSIHYGRFFPGSAYDDHDARDFLYTALTFSF